MGLSKNTMTYDIHWVRENPEIFDAGLVKRGLKPHSQQLMALDKRHRAHIACLQEAQTQRNAASKEIGKAKANSDERAATKLIHEIAKLKKQIHAAEEQERELASQLYEALSQLPNVPLPDVPIGEDESANVEHHKHGTPRNINFTPKEHFDLGEELAQMDFDTAARLSGSRFVVLKDGLARLERALANFMIDLHTNEHGYTEIAPPLLIRDKAMFGTGQLPKFSTDSFATTDGLWLIPTSEVPLTNLVREQILHGSDLPLRFSALTPCFRSEAGSAGRDTRGMLRQHQFTKVELVSITDANTSLQELERMLACAENVLKRLDLHYRVVTLSTGDMGFSAQKTYDIEVWLPGQNAYREISSCSLCGDFQARRMHARYRLPDQKTIQHVHTLNGSGVATGRALIAILENYQNEDGSIAIPDVLQSLMGGVSRLEKTAK